MESPEAFFDRCFTALRPLQRSFQIATKLSSDGETGMRIALETGTRLGTAGTFPWLPVRLALATGTERLCITDEAALARAYRAPVRHNCRDAVDLTSGDRRYEILAPDTRIPAPARTTATLSIYAGGTLVQGPTSLRTTACTTQVPGAPCLSGGPCD